MARKAASGSGTIRKKTITKGGKSYTYWEARYTVGYDPGTGKQLQKSITGKTQKEVAQKLKAVTSSIDSGSYIAPNRMTVGQWLDIWSAEYLGAVKPRTAELYKSTIEIRIKPGLGASKLEALTPHAVQTFYNTLGTHHNGMKPLAPKTIKNVHGILHKALQQALMNGYIKSNPADSCIIPKAIRKELKPLDEGQITEFLKAIQGHEYESLFTVTLFTGMRESEALGLLWECVDLDKGTITINKQLQAIRGSGGQYQLAPTKNSKARTVTVAPTVISILRRVRIRQFEVQLQHGELYENTGYVFTNDLGQHLSHNCVYKAFKKIMREIGSPETRFHDLRHSYAVASIKSGDDVKTVQANLGHATAAFTLDVYGHVTEQMKKDSAARMEQFIKIVNG